jgi:phosphatidate cytidylyltransferase
VIPRRGPAAAKASLVRRILSAVVFIPAFLLLLYGAGVGLFSMFVLLLSARAQWEFTRMFQRDGETVYPLLGLLAGVAVTASFHVEGLTPDVLTAALVVLLSAPLVGSRAPDFRPTALTLLGVGYVNWLLGYAIWLRRLPHGAPWIVFLLAVTWMGETAAYIVGSRLGRRKLAPAISPGKSVEGFAGGLIAAATVAVIVALKMDWPVVRVGLIGLSVALAGVVGDLSKSTIKRAAGVKDSGAILPGHGGVLDRFDAVLFGVPVGYYLWRWLA